MERLAIIDHNAHRLYIDDVSDETLEKYNGSEEAYIQDNYTIEDNFYSWDFILDAEYIYGDDPTPMDIDFDDLKDN